MLSISGFNKPQSSARRIKKDVRPIVGNSNTLPLWPKALPNCKGAFFLGNIDEEI